MAGDFNIWRALEARYSGEAWGYFTEVRNCTGWARQKIRTADAVAVGLWPSRGIDVHGIEVKASRADWLRELKSPAKAEDGLFPFCDFWWLAVTDREIVAAGELPPTWGLLVPRGVGLMAEVPAPRLDALPPDRNLLAAILKKAKDYRAGPEEVQEKMRAEYDRGVKHGKEVLDWDQRRDKDEVKKLQFTIKTFEEAAGIEIEYDPAAKGEKYRRFLDVDGREDAAQHVENTVRQLRWIAERLEKELGEFRGMKKEISHGR